MYYVIILLRSGYIMSSRAKKKATSSGRENQRVESIVTDEHYCEKWQAIYAGITIATLIIMFIMILVAPMLSANLKFSLSGKSDDAQEYSFDVTALDALIAPLRGCNTGFRFILEKMGATFASNENYQEMEDALSQYLKQETVDNINELGVSVFINTIILFTIFIAAIVIQIFDAKCKRKGLLSLIGFGTFFAMVLYYFIFCLAVNARTVLSSSSIVGGWGVWILFILAIAYLVVNIINYIKFGKEKRNENL